MKPGGRDTARAVDTDERAKPVNVKHRTAVNAVTRRTVTGTRLAPIGNAQVAHNHPTAPANPR